MTRVRVLVADDHAIVREGLRAVLAAEDDLEVVAEAETSEDAVRLARELRPDVAVVDLRMPGSGGLDATREMARAVPAVAVLILTMHEDDASVFAAMRAGARGYVLKGSRRGDVVRAIRAVAQGDAIFGPGVAQRVMDFVATAHVRDPVLPELTGREREVLALVARGRRNADVARELGLTLKTVRNHVSNIVTKLQVSDRAQAVARARDAGLGAAEP